MEPKGDRPVELRINAPGWDFYGRTFLLWLLGVVLALFYWGLEAVVLITGPDYTIGGIPHRVGIVNQLWAIIFGGAGTLVALGMPALAVYGTIQSWRYWRQLRWPAVVISTEGIRFEARRRPLLVPWAQVERLKLDRSEVKRKARHGIKTRIRSGLKMRVTSDSAVLRADNSPLRANRWLLIDTEIEKVINMPYDDAVEFLRSAAGPRLEMTKSTRWAGSSPANP